MEEKNFFVKDDQGNEKEFEIILTFESPETKEKYVIYKELGDTDDVMAAIYTETGDGTGNLEDIESEEEFQMVQDVLDAFYDEEDQEESE
jgi:uncharacterized protein YrzB (UPF0473 family)